MDSFLFKNKKSNQHLTGKNDTNQKRKKRQAISGKKDYSAEDIFTSALTTAREIPTNKGKNPDKMCQLIFLKIYPQ